MLSSATPRDAHRRLIFPAKLERSLVRLNDDGRVNIASSHFELTDVSMDQFRTAMRWRHKGKQHHTDRVRETDTDRPLRNLCARNGGCKISIRGDGDGGRGLAHVNLRKNCFIRVRDIAITVYGGSNEMPPPGG